MQLSARAAFTQYLDIVNRALGEHRDETPYRQVFELGEKTLGGKDIGVGMYKDNPNHPHGWFTVRLDDGTFDLVDDSKPDDPDLKWIVRRDHVDHVIEEPAEFIADPWKLDLDWLRSTVGLN